MVRRSHNSRSFAMELVNDGLDEGAFAQQELVGEVEELIAHVLAQFGDQPQPLGEEEALDERCGDGAVVATEAFSSQCSASPSPDYHVLKTPPQGTVDYLNAS